MNNIIKPVACEIISIKRESVHEYTFRVATDIKPNPGQFLQLSIPKVGEAPISVSSYGEGWMEFTIRSVGKVTDEIFEMQPGDHLFLRGPYGHGWPIEQYKGKHVVVITGGTGLAPVKSKDGWNTGFVTEFVSKVPLKEFGEDYEMVIVGPPPMMKFTGLEAVKCGAKEEKIWVSFERKMSCAVGKCGHCRIDEVYVCLDGPVFNYTQAKNLID